MALTTQSRHPWRATTRTAVAVGVGLLPLLPEILGGLHLDTYALAGQVLVIAAGITRLLANPSVEVLLHQYAPWLAAQPPLATGGIVPAGQTYIVGEKAPADYFPPPTIAPPVPGRYTIMTPPKEDQP